MNEQRELESRGHIYKSSYSGWYAVSDEAYYSETQVKEVVDASGAKQMVSSLLMSATARTAYPYTTILTGLNRDGNCGRVDVRRQLQIPTFCLPRALNQVALRVPEWYVKLQLATRMFKLMRCFRASSPAPISYHHSPRRNFTARLARPPRPLHLATVLAPLVGNPSTRRPGAHNLRLD